MMLKSMVTLIDDSAEGGMTQFCRDIDSLRAKTFEMSFISCSSRKVNFDQNSEILGLYFVPI